MRAFHKLTPDETFIFHFRYDLHRPISGGVPVPMQDKELFMRRALTVAIIFVGDTAYIGVAPCSWQDQFIRKVGYQMALGRAKRAADVTYGQSAGSGGVITSKDKLEWARATAEKIKRDYLN